jgi:hypothetical protein
MANEEKETKELKAKILFRCSDTLWQLLKVAHRRKYPNDPPDLNTALTRAAEEFASEEVSEIGQG